MKTELTQEADLTSNTTNLVLTNNNFIYVNDNTDTSLVTKLVVLTGDTEQNDFILDEEVNAQFPLFFPNVTQILVPKKSQYNLEKYVPKELLREIDPDINLAIEKCLLFLSNLASTFYTENKWKNLYSKILHEQTKNKDNTYIYSKIIAALKVGTKNTGAIIEIKTNKDGKESYNIGSASKQYRLTQTYLKAGLTTYTLKDEKLIQQRNRLFYKQLKEANKNIICKNLIDFYSEIELPTVAEIKKEGKRLVKLGFKTKKGKKLTHLNKHTKEYFKDAYTRSFVEDNIDLFEFLTKRGFMIPTPGDEKSGGRVVDSFTLMPSWIRNLCKVNGQFLAEADYSALHPNIAVSIYGGNSEFITHQKVAEEANIELLEAKVEHLSFFNKNWRQMSESPLFDFYTKKEPKMMEAIFRDKEEYDHKITSMRMFKVEVEVMAEVIDELNKKGIQVLYVYDALMCEPSVKNIVVECMNTVIINHGVKTIAK